jgi:hypothetical protein
VRQPAERVGSGQARDASLKDILGAVASGSVASGTADPGVK